MGRTNGWIVKYNYMTNRIVTLFACIFALCIAAVSAPAQSRQSSHDFSDFDAIEADYDFNIRVVRARDYSISMNVETDLQDHVQAYVKNHTLYLKLDERSMPSDLRKKYRGRRAVTPRLDATVYMAEPLTSVKLSGASTLAVEDDIECRDFVLDMSENSSVTKLLVDADNVTVTMAGKSSAELVVYADNLKLNAAGNSSAVLEQDSQRIEIVAGGSAQIEMEGETLDAQVTASGTSKTVLKGKTNALSVTGSATALVDALNLKTSECTVKLSSLSKLYEAATETVHVELSGNSTLIFDGDPVIDIINVKSSTIQRYSNSKK